MMLPIRISVSVTPAARAGCGVGTDTNKSAAKKAGSSHFIVVFINAASNAKLSELVTPPSGHDDSAGDLVVKMKCCGAWDVARMSACDMRESCRQESRISLR